MSDHEVHSGSKNRLLFMFILTFTYMIAELVVGYIGKSTSLIADAFHMLSDVIALTVAFMAILLSPKKWKKSTFGWARAEVLGALVNSVFLLALCFSILVESVKRFFEPQRVEQPIWVFFVGLGGLIINIIGLFIFSGKEGGHGHGHSHDGGRRGSLIQNQGRLTRMVGADEIISDETASVKVVRVVPTPQPVVPSPQPVVPAAAESTNTSKKGSRINAVSTDVENELKEPRTESPPAPVENLRPEDPRTFMPEPEVEETLGRVGNSDQMNIKGVFLHLMADALGSVIVVVSAGIVWGTEKLRANDEASCRNEKLWAYIDYIDPALSTILVLLIVGSTWPLLQEASLILLQTVPSHIDVEELKNKILQEVDGVLMVHEFHIWQLAGDRIIASIHIVCADINDYSRISRQVKQLFHREGIHSTTVQAEFNTSTTNLSGKDCLLDCPNPNGHSPGSCTSNTCCGPQRK